MVGDGEGEFLGLLYEEPLGETAGDQMQPVMRNLDGNLLGLGDAKGDICNNNTNRTFT